jgi:hypothetical protein
MLNEVQRWIVFVLFCLIVLGCGVLEGYQGYWAVQNRFNVVSAFWAILFGGVLVGCGSLFLRLISRTFLMKGVTPGRIHEFASERRHIIENARHSQMDQYVIRVELVTNTLKFSEEWLKGWVRGSHLELCVFVDREEPVLFAYFDSNRHTRSRSMAERENNHRFYVDRGYEVTKLLRQPTSEPVILRDTSDARINYAFTSSHQRKQLRSSLLICPDVTSPCALVLSSNKKNAFRENETELMSFIRYICETVRYDLVEGDFLNQIRGLRPNLFSPTKESKL